MGNQTIAQQIVIQLRAHGHRITKVRQGLLEIFEEKNGPIAVRTVLSALGKKKLGTHKTTIYRELEFLTEHGIVREVDFGEGEKRYELSIDDHHHHHLVCTKCEAVQCLDIDHSQLEKLEKEILKKQGFKVTEHVLEFFGLCANCLPR